MKLFKTIDDKFAEIGFVKMEENEYGVRYQRMDEWHDYVQCLDISHKYNRLHIVQSYDKDLMDSKLIGNTCVGLTYYEMKLVMKKMKKLGYHKSSKKRLLERMK